MKLVSWKILTNACKLIGKVSFMIDEFLDENSVVISLITLSKSINDDVKRLIIGSTWNNGLSHSVDHHHSKNWLAQKP